MMLKSKKQLLITYASGVTSFSFLAAIIKYMVW